MFSAIPLYCRLIYHNLQLNTALLLFVIHFEECWQICEKRLLASPCISVCLSGPSSTWNNTAPKIQDYTLWMNLGEWVMEHVDMFMYKYEVANSVTLQLYLQAKFYYIIVQFKIKQIYMPSGSGPFQLTILGAQLSQRRKRLGSKRLWTICNASTSFSKAMVMNGKEKKNEQKERGRTTETGVKRKETQDE